MLEALERRKAPTNRIAGADLLEILAHLAHALRREVGVLLDRNGAVAHVIVSRRWQALADEMGRRAGGHGSKLRYIEAHPHADGRPDDGDSQVLERLDLDLVVTVGTSRGRPTGFWLLEQAPAHPDGDGARTAVEGPHALEMLDELDLHPLTRRADAARRQAGARSTAAGRLERAVLVALNRSGDATPSLSELASLARTAGADPVATVIQRRTRPDPARYLGKGKVDEVLRATEAFAADLVLVDDELTPVQQRVLEGDLGVKVLDRTALVLDIFAHRARSREGRLQVELAQLNYLLPRLTGRGVLLSRLGGGIGTRGPGETKLEVDRRRIRARITELQREINAVQRHRGRQRQPRQEAALPQVALVGYTNTGKSTLLNALTGASVFVEDKLFATLDPTVRRLVLPDRRPIVMADTVGFIRRLPTQLIAAFRATLEEVVHADLLLHVADASHPDWPEQVRVVGEVLASLGAGSHPTLLVFNKIDVLAAEGVRRLIAAHPDAVAVSAARSDGLPELLDAIGRRLPEPWVRLRLHVPYSNARLVAQIHNQGRMLAEQYGEEGAWIEAEVPGPLAVQLRALKIPSRARRTRAEGSG
ncbi:MAG: GTPase HflX [bacterium]|nr:GTPase HflX [bacterium]